MSEVSNNYNPPSWDILTSDVKIPANYPSDEYLASQGIGSYTATSTTSSSSNTTTVISNQTKSGSGFNFGSFFGGIAKSLPAIIGLGGAAFGIASLFNGGLFKTADNAMYPQSGSGGYQFYYPSVGIPQGPLAGVNGNVGSFLPTQIPNIPFGGNPVYNPNRGMLTFAKQAFFPFGG